MIDRDEYCRKLEAFLCRKNDGHLIRIVGPAFDRVKSWAEQGIPVKVAEAGIDRYFVRYYRKGPRRRPVRIEFCEADVLDAFDDWRRAVGVTLVTTDPEGGPPVEEPGQAAPRSRRSLAAHIEGALARLMSLRDSGTLAGIADGAITTAIAELEALHESARHVRGDARDKLIDRLQGIERSMTESIAGLIEADRRAELDEEARRELAPFKRRMDEAAFERARVAAFARLVRDAHQLPDLSF